jgi:hypothetical protein
MKQHMPGAPPEYAKRVLPAGTGPFGAQEGYVDCGPRREWRSDGRSMHGPLDHTAEPEEDVVARKGADPRRIEAGR